MRAIPAIKLSRGVPGVKLSLRRSERVTIVKRAVDDGAVHATGGSLEGTKPTARVGVVLGVRVAVGEGVSVGDVVGEVVSVAVKEAVGVGERVVGAGSVTGLDKGVLAVFGGVGSGDVVSVDTVVVALGLGEGVIGRVGVGVGGLGVSVAVDVGAKVEVARATAGRSCSSLSVRLRIRVRAQKMALRVNKAAENTKTRKPRCPARRRCIQYAPLRLRRKKRTEIKNSKKPATNVIAVNSGRRAMISSNDISFPTLMVVFQIRACQIKTVPL